MASATSPDPRSGGLLHALYTLVKPATFEGSAPSHDALAYSSRRRSGVKPLLDVYLPAARVDGAPHRSVIVVHGGGFVIGHRKMKPVRLVASRLAEEGFAVCALDYRLLFRGGGLDAQLADVNEAAAFWRDRAESFGCDPGRISMLGFSAGATLMLLSAGATGHAYERLVSIYGATDFERVSGRRASTLLGLVLGTRDRERWRERSPIMRALVPTPVLLVHGTRDDMVPVEHAVRYHEARRARGLPSELELVPDMRHGFVNDASLPQTEHTVRRAIAFLRG